MAKKTDGAFEPGEATKDWEVNEFPKVMPGLNKAFVLGGAFFQDIVVFMAQAGYERAKTIEDADVVVFVGGADINPRLYGQEAIPECQFWNDQRDIQEMAAYQFCVKHGKVMFGICRGAQFLHAMNKGELWQHVENHAGPDHAIYDIDEDVRVTATSLHHQMLMPNDRIDVIAITEHQVSTVFKNADMFIDLRKEGANAPHEIEIEAGAYHDTRCFFVQGHPEIGNRAYQTWTLTKLKELAEEWATAPEPAPEPSMKELESVAIRNLLDNATVG